MHFCIIAMYLILLLHFGNVEKCCVGKLGWCVVPRYQFRNSKRVGLQELGPRFTLRPRYLQKGTFDSKNGEYYWIFKVCLKKRSFALKKPHLYVTVLVLLYLQYCALSFIVTVYNVCV